MQPSVIHTPRAGHSEKPTIIHKKIEQLYPSYSKIELFARKKVEGWDHWGNEVGQNLQVELITGGWNG